MDDFIFYLCESTNIMNKNMNIIIINENVILLAYALRPAIAYHRLAAGVRNLFWFIWHLELAKPNKWNVLGQLVSGIR